MTNETCMAARCNKSAMPDSTLCKEHYDALPAPMRGEQPTSKERVAALLENCASCLRNDMTPSAVAAELDLIAERLRNSLQPEAEWSEGQRVAHEAPAQSSNELVAYAIDLVDGPNSGVIGRMKRDAEGNYYLRADVDAVIERLRERVKDLQQFHDWAEPQITDLNRDSYSKLLREIDEYLSRSPAEAIHASSIFHQQIKEALQSTPPPTTDVCIETAFAGTTCPFTKRPYFMHLEHEELGRVPTYGGPFDSYTIPAPDDDGHMRCERYDHDAGNWVDGGEPTGLLVISERQLSRLTQPPLPDYRTAMKQAEDDDGIDSLTLVRVLQKKVADQQRELARLNARASQPPYDACERLCRAVDFYVANHTGLAELILAVNEICGRTPTKCVEQS